MTRPFQHLPGVQYPAPPQPAPFKFPRPAAPVSKHTVNIGGKNVSLVWLHRNGLRAVKVVRLVDGVAVATVKLERV